LKKLEKLNIIYIAGYGRSGSTLLSMILNIIPGVSNLGEVANLFSLDTSLLPQYWVSLRDEVMSNTSKPKNAIKKFSSVYWFFSKKKGIKLFEKFWNPVLLRYSEDRKVSVLIDASKTTNSTIIRPYYYKKQGASIKSIHLIRDLNGVVASFTKGRNSAHSKELRKPKKGGAYRAIFNWFVTNMFTSIQHKLFFNKEEYYVLSYDTFINDYDAEIKNLLVFLNLPLEKSLLKSEILLESDYSFSGNRVRLNKTISITPSTSNKISGLKGILIRLAVGLFKLIETDYKST